MSDQMLERESASLVSNDTGNRVLVQLVKLGEARTVSDDGGRTQYREAIDSVVLADKVLVRSSHGGPMIGHADMSTYDANPDPTIELVIAPTAAGSDSLALIRSGALDAVSVEFVPDPGDKESDGVMRRSNALVHAVALAARPAHTAPILAQRETPEPKEPEMSEAITPDVTPEVTREDLDALGDDLKREMLTIATAPAPAPVYGDLEKYRSLGEFTLAVANGDADSRSLTRALFDQVTGDNAGVVPPGWVTTIYGIIDRGRRTVNAFGTTGLPGSGMDINWPYFAGDLTAIVAAQSAEKAAINSVQVSILKGTSNIATYAGGSDLSYQLIRRSEPSYLDAYMRIMSLAYAAETDAAANAQALAAATAGTVWVPATGTADELRDSLFGASIAVETATGAPAGFAVVASDVFAAIGSLADLWPSNYGTQNVAGTADAASLRVSVSGLPILHDPYAASGSFIVSNSQAGKWAEEGPMTVSAEDVELLGQNVAVWGMGVFTPLLPAGIISIAAA